MAELAEYQYEMNGFLLGRQTAYAIESVQFEAPEIRQNDRNRPRADGLRFGRDFRAGRTILFDGTVLTTGSAVEAINALENAWLADDIRDTPGAVAALRMRRNGRTRVVWGRPRRIAVVSSRTSFGWAPFTADFVAADHLYYGDTVESETVSIVPPQGGGVVSPVVSPVTTLAQSARQGDITVSGVKDTPIKIQINGPITDPSVELLGGWTITFRGLTLASDDYVVIDPRPWAMTILTRFGVNVAGKLTADSPKLSDIKLPPGVATLTLRGTDATGTASMTMSWSPAYASF